MEKEPNIFSKCTNSNEQGNMGLTDAMRYFAWNRYTISTTLNDSQEYDLLVERKDIGIKKVQVKTTSYKRYGGVYIVAMRTKARNYVKAANTLDYDLLYVLCDNCDTYLIPKKDLKNIKNCLTLGKKYQKYKLTSIFE